MPKRKADAWPPEILSDPDVLSLDDEGRFVLCKVCHVHYAVHGGKKPKPVIMNSSYRTRAWDVHKERTNCHRMQKKQEEMRQRHHAESMVSAIHRSLQDSSRRNINGTHRNGRGQHLSAALPEASAPHQDHLTPALSLSPNETVAQQHAQVREHERAHRSPPSRRSRSRSQTPTAPPQAAPPAIASDSTSACTSTSNNTRLFSSKNPNTDLPSPERSNPDGTVAMHPADQTIQSSWGGPMSSSVKMMRRCVNANGTLPQITKDQRSSNDQKNADPPSVAGMMRWRSMHEDVSRALNTAPKRPISEVYAPNNNRSSRVMAETEDFAGNTEKVAKKLKSLEDEYMAKYWKNSDQQQNRMRMNNKDYWGTLRDVYGSSNTKGNTLPSLRANNPEENYGKTDSTEDSTTPDDTARSAGSSDEPSKPTVVHDQGLVNAIDRLTGVVSKHLFDRYTKETAAALDALTGLTEAVTEMRVRQDEAFSRMIELQEQRLQVAEGILQYKLRKESSRQAFGMRNGVMPSTMMHFPATVATPHMGGIIERDDRIGGIQEQSESTNAPSTTTASLPDTKESNV